MRHATFMKVLPWLIAIVVLAFIPTMVKSDYWLYILTMISMYIMLTAGLRLIMSTGQCSFCHAAFWGIGAYSSALLMMKLGLPFWCALPLAGIIAAIIAILVGLPCLRLKGPYFFIITLAFGELIRLIEVSWVSFLGGSNGIRCIPPPDPISLPGLPIIAFQSKASFFYLMIPLLLISLFVFYRLERSRFGMVCNAIRESDELAGTVGVNVMRYKMLAFVAACFFAGIAGSFYASYTSYINPRCFGIPQSLMLLIFMMAGGVYSVSGVIIGSTLLTFVEQIFRVVKEYEPIIYGFIFVIVLIFLPGGLWSLLQRIPASIRARRVAKEKV